jgi:hypothetical protein
MVGSGGGSLKYAVALLGAHTPSKNPRPISGLQAYTACLLGSEISDVRSRLAKGSKRAKREARPLKIHLEFIGLRENAGEQVHVEGPKEKTSVTEKDRQDE